MKKMVIVFAAFLLSGCIVYPTGRAYNTAYEIPTVTKEYCYTQTAFFDGAIGSRVVCEYREQALYPVPYTGPGISGGIILDRDYRGYNHNRHDYYDHKDDRRYERRNRRGNRR